MLSKKSLSLLPAYGETSLDQIQLTDEAKNTLHSDYKREWLEEESDRRRSFNRRVINNALRKFIAYSKDIEKQSPKKNDSDSNCFKCITKSNTHLTRRRNLRKLVELINSKNNSDDVRNSAAIHLKITLKTYMDKELKKPTKPSLLNLLTLIGTLGLYFHV